MAVETTNPASAQELSDIFESDVEDETSEGDPKQDQTQESTNEDNDNSLTGQGAEQSGQTSDTEKAFLDEGETDARSSEANQNIAAEDGESDVDLETALKGWMQQRGPRLSGKVSSINLSRVPIMILYPR